MESGLRSFISRYCFIMGVISAMGSPTLFLFSSSGRRSYVAACLFSAGECPPTVP